MKKLWIVPVIVALLLCGCSAQETFETVLDALDGGEPTLVIQVVL